MCKTTTQKIINTSLGDSENINKWRGNSLVVQWLRLCGHRTGKGKLSFQSQRRAMPRMFKLPENYIHFTCWQGYTQNPSN